MGNRLSGLWCKKTTTAIHINNDSKQQQQQSDNNTRNNNNNNKSNRRKTGGAAGGFGGTFRLGSARRLSLTSCVSRDKTEKKTTTNRSLAPASSAISSIEQQYEELHKPQHSQTLPRAKSAMKVDSAIPTVKVRGVLQPDLRQGGQQVSSWACLAVAPQFAIRYAQRNYLW